MNYLTPIPVVTVVVIYVVLSVLMLITAQDIAEHKLGAAIAVENELNSLKQDLCTAGIREYCDSANVLFSVCSADGYQTCRPFKNGEFCVMRRCNSSNSQSTVYRQAELLLIRTDEDGSPIYRYTTPTTTSTIINVSEAG